MDIDKKEIIPIVPVNVRSENEEKEWKLFHLHKLMKLKADDATTTMMVSFLNFSWILQWYGIGRRCDRNEDDKDEDDENEDDWLRHAFTDCLGHQ